MNKAGVIQMQSGPNITENLAITERLIYEAVEQGGLMANHAQDTIQAGEALGEEGPMQNAVAACVKRAGIWVIAGTIPLHSLQNNRVYAGCTVWDETWRLVIHYKESNTYTPGNELVVVDTPIGTVGLSVCYDLRFADMYHALRWKKAQQYLWCQRHLLTKLALPIGIGKCCYVLVRLKTSAMFWLSISMACMTMVARLMATA